MSANKQPKKKTTLATDEHRWNAGLLGYGALVAGGFQDIDLEEPQQARV